MLGVPRPTVATTPFTDQSVDLVFHAAAINMCPLLSAIRWQV